MDSGEEHAPAPGDTGGVPTAPSVADPVTGDGREASPVGAGPDDRAGAAARSARALAVGLAVAAAVAAVLAIRAEPTGHPVTDALLTALMAGAVTFLGAHARPLPLATAAVVAAVAGPPAGFAVAAAVGALAAGALALLQRRAIVDRRVAAALAGASALLSVQALLQLRPTEPARGTAALTLAVLVPVVWTGWRGLDAPSRRAVRWGAAGVAVLAGVGALTGAAAGLVALREITSGVDRTDEAREAVRQGEQDEATDLLRLAEADLAAARGRTRAWWSFPARHTPIVAQQLAAMDLVADGGARSAGLAVSSSERIDSSRLRIVDGRLDPQVVVDAEPVLRDVAEGTARIQRDFRRDLTPSVWRLPPVDGGLEDFDEALADARSSAETGVLAAEVGPELLGADGVARYFIAFVSPSEARGTGFLGNYGLLTITDGEIDLEVVGRNDELDDAGDDTRTITGPPDYVERYLRFAPQHTWENVTFTPDGPTAAQVIAELYPQSGGPEIDGVIRIDPTGLSRLLRVTGPVAVEGLPYELDDQNVVHFLQVEQYRLFQVDSERTDLLGVVAETVFDRLTSGEGPGPSWLADALGPAVEGGHVSLWLRSERGEALVERLGVTGAVPAVVDDGFGVVAQNAGGGKIDLFMERTVRYEAEVDATTGRLTATATVELHNTAPSEGEPFYMIGNLLDLPDGTNRTWLSLYSPHSLVAATVDGEPVELETERELGRNVWSQFVLIPSGGTVVVELELEGAVDLSDGTFRFDWLPQITVVPDRVEVEVTFAGATPTVSGTGRAPDGGVRVEGATVRAHASETQGPWAAVVTLAPDP